MGGLRLIAGGRPAVGLLANRPAPSGNARTYFATDDNGGTLYISDGSTWSLVAPRGTELMALERTATNIALTAATQVDVTGLNGTVVSRGRPLRVSFGCGLIQCTAAANGLSGQLMEDVGDTGTFTQVAVLVRAVAAANGFTSGGAAIRERPAQAAGTVIRYKVQMANLVAGAVTTTISCNANGSQPFLYVHEA